MPIMETMERKKPRPRRSFTPEFKAEIVECCQRRHVTATWATERPDRTYSMTIARNWAA
jgi:transposase